MIKLFLIFMLLAVPVLADHNPVGLKQWHNGGRSFSTQIGGPVRNYQVGSAWAQINNNFVAEGDSVFKVDASVIKIRVNKNGESSSTLTWGGADYVITQNLFGIGWLKISTKNKQWIDSTMNFSNVSVDSNIVKWTGVSPAVDYRVRKLNGQIQHGIFFKSAFLDSAVILYNQRADSLDIALANVMAYTLSGNIDNADSALGDLSKRQLKSFGEYTFDLKEQSLKYPGSDTLRAIPVRQFWKKRNDTIFSIEYVMMSEVKRVHELYPDSVVWHNATTKISGTTDVEDTDMRSNLATSSFGIRNELRVANFSVTLIRAIGLSALIGAGAIFTDAICSLKVKASTFDGDIDACSVFKPWLEGAYDFEECIDDAVTWEDWDCDPSEWTVAGCGCADDDGIDNATTNPATCLANGTNADRKSTPESTVNVTTVGAWHGFDISNALAQSWYDGTKNEEGIALVQNVTGDNQFYSSEDGAGQDPFFVFTYTLTTGTTLEGVTLEGVTIE